MSGVPGSGKSSWARAKAATLNDSAIVSRDAIRLSLLKDGEEYFSKEDETWEIFINSIKEYLNPKSNIENIFVDATHITKNSRKKILNAIGREELEKVVVNIVVMDVPLETCFKWNDGRTGRAYVPHAAIEKMFNSFTIPKIEEGFDNIFILTYENEKISEITKIQKEIRNGKNLDDIGSSFLS